MILSYTITLGMQLLRKLLVSFAEHKMLILLMVVPEMWNYHAPLFPFHVLLITDLLRISKKGARRWSKSVIIRRQQKNLYQLSTRSIIKKVTENCGDYINRMHDSKNNTHAAHVHTWHVPWKINATNLISTADNRTHSEQNINLNS